MLTIRIISSFVKRHEHKHQGLLYEGLRMALEVLNDSEALREITHLAKARFTLSEFVYKMAMCSRIVFHAREAKLYSCRFMRSLFTKAKDVETEKVSPLNIKLNKENLTSTNYNMNMLKQNRSLTAKLSYVPPANIHDIIRNVGLKHFGDEWENAQLSDPVSKFKVLSEIISQTNHDVPNAMLTDMNYMSDVINFYEQEVKQCSTYDELAAGKLGKLPANLNIQLEPLRFDPETDTMFGGRTAFPGSDVVVTSIKYKRKYKDIKTTKEKPGFTNYYYGY